jgi:hypothetical protein
VRAAGVTISNGKHTMTGLLVRWNAPPVVVSLAALAGCVTRTAAPQPLTSAERDAIADTLRQLYRETSQTFDSDFDCEEIVDRLSKVAPPPFTEVSSCRTDL